MASGPPPPPPKGLHFPKGVLIPDWRTYKVEDCPELLEVQRKLAARGLKDPWLRNEAWRYNRAVFGTKRSRTIKFFTRGMRTGAVLLAITYALENTILKKDDHHGHGHSKDAHHSEH